LSRGSTRVNVNTSTSGFLLEHTFIEGVISNLLAQLIETWVTVTVKVKVRVRDRVRVGLGLGLGLGLPSHE
jgi:hypothetical protein